MENNNDITGKHLVAHWRWAAEKGIMNQNSANSLRAACTQVLGVLDDWESINVTQLDVDATLERFQNLRKSSFKPESLDAYKRRFRQAVASYIDYLRSPSSWKPRTAERVPRQDRERKTNNGVSAHMELPNKPGPAGESTFIDYPFPIRTGHTALLRLPHDLNLSEAKRLGVFLSALAVDFDGHSG